MSGSSRYELKPHEIFRHPTCRELSKCILTSEISILSGQSGYGTSMFARAHCDVYWPRGKTLMIVADSELTTSEVLDQIRDSGNTHMYIDLIEPWTYMMIKNFCKKVYKTSAIRTIVIVNANFMVSQHNHFTFSKGDESTLHFNLTDSNNYEFFLRNKTFFEHFVPRNIRQFLEMSHTFQRNLSKLIQKFRYGTESVNIFAKDFWRVSTYEEFQVFIENDPTFDFVKYRNLDDCVEIFDCRSMASVKLDDILDFNQSEDDEGTAEIHFPNFNFQYLMYSHVFRRYS